MTRETTYFVQAFNAGKGGNLKADARCPSFWDSLRIPYDLAYLYPDGRKPESIRLRVSEDLNDQVRPGAP